MTDFTHEWIAKREQLEQAATEGPWHWEPSSMAGKWPTLVESLATEDGEAVLLGWGDDAFGIEGDPADREFIADARTSLPAALAALKAVLDEHPRYEGDFSDFCGHCQARGEGVWPCPTVTAIHAALRGES